MLPWKGYDYISFNVIILMIRYGQFTSRASRSNGRFDRVANPFEVLLAWVHFLADCYESFDALHPFARLFFIEDMRHFGSISPNCNAEHGYSEGPGRVADGEVDVFIISLYVFAN